MRKCLVTSHAENWHTGYISVFVNASFTDCLENECNYLDEIFARVSRVECLRSNDCGLLLALKTDTNMSCSRFFFTPEFSLHVATASVIFVTLEPKPKPCSQLKTATNESSEQRRSQV